MRAKTVLPPVLAGLALTLVACGGGQPETLSAPAFAQAAPPAQAGPPAHDKGKVPIADVADIAAGVNEGRKQQASGLRKNADRGKGHKAGDVSDTALAGGCHPDYGKDGECLPPVPPRLVGQHAGHSGMDPEQMSKLYTCDDVRALIPNGIQVRTDTLGLDSNNDGTACGADD